MSFQRIAATIINDCCGVRPGERVVIVTDMHRAHIAQALYEASALITTTDCIGIPIGRYDGDEIPDDAADACLDADVILAPTTMSVSHTKAMVAARKNGARVATLPGITDEIFLRCIDIDYTALQAVHAQLLAQLQGSHTIRVCSPSGTDLTFSVEGRTWHSLDGICRNPGAFVNLPDGEVMIAPLEGTAEGRVVVDLSMSPDQHTQFGCVGKLEGEIIAITFAKGYATAIEGAGSAAIVNAVLRDAGSEAFQLAEFAIGTNPKARIIGNILEDEKVCGTAHIALGTNSSFGGTITCGVHLDGVFGAPDVWCDGVQIISKGQSL